jgi:hypothetical protein
MAIRIVPYDTATEEPARAFNARLKPLPEAPFFLPEHAPQPRESTYIRSTQCVALDETDACRGGILTQEHPAWLNGAESTVINVQSPLSEAIVDPKYAMVGAQLFRFVLKKNPHVFVIGMGGNPESPLPRLLTVMGWRVRHIPFYFHMLRPARCLKELQTFQRSGMRKTVASIASATGLAQVGAKIVHWGISPSKEWKKAERPPDFADRVWSGFTQRCQFSIVRDSRTLPEWYRPGSEPCTFFHQEREGWFSLLIAEMREHHHFGNATVATLVDCLAPEALLPDAVATAIRKAKESGADLLVANFTYGPLQAACRAAGMRNGPSNCLLATSKALSEGMTDEQTYISRRDGDGLIHLVSNH